QAKQHPDMSPEQIECWVDAAYEVGGLQAWADMYYQHLEPDENRLHNRQSYLRLIRGHPFRQAVEKRCWN
ncbi:MAG: hypothetical protein R3350_06905, partial [Saprospiraceae bacterium]|nr:hypothetical protein [Saprospiraceae bacterium]